MVSLLTSIAYSQLTLRIDVQLRAFKFNNIQWRFLGSHRSRSFSGSPLVGSSIKGDRALGTAVRRPGVFPEGLLFPQTPDQTRHKRTASLTGAVSAHRAVPSPVEKAYFKTSRSGSGTKVIPSAWVAAIRSLLGIGTRNKLALA